MKWMRGISIVEFILTLVIVATSIPPLLIAYSRMQERGVQMMPLTVASHLAREQMEQLVQWKPFIEVLSVPTTPFSNPFGNYRYQAVVDYVNSNDLNVAVTPTVTDYKRVVITVTNSQIPTLNVSLTTLVTNTDGG